MANESQGKIEELEKEIQDLYGDLENLQDEILKKDAIILELTQSQGSKKGTSSAMKKHVAIELEEKDKEIRDLKNKMGYLRKEKIDLERELKKFTEIRTSTVIPIEEKKTPLKSLVDDLQGQLKKLRIENSLLKKQLDTGISPETEKTLELKEEEINMLKKKISDLTNKSISQTGQPQNKKITTISSDLSSELQNKLNRAKLEIESLKKQLKQKHGGDDKEEVKTLKLKIEELQYQLALKEKSEMQSPSSSSPFSGLSTELQEKLNTARIQIKSLQDQLKNYEQGGSSNKKEPFITQQQGMSENLTKLKENVAQLTKKVKEQEHILSVKEERIISLTEKLKISPASVKSKTLENDTPLALRVRELSKMVEELKKNNIQQRIEISELRRK